MQGTGLEKQEEIQRFLSVLNAHGLQKEQQQVVLLVKYLDEMDQQFQAVLEELKAVNEQLKRFQQWYGVEGLSDALGAAVNTGNQIVRVKDNLIRNAKTSVSKIQQQGTGALQRTVAAMKIPAALAHLKEGLHGTSKQIERSIAQIGRVQKEIQAAGIHAKNAGRAMVGKETLPAKGVQSDKGLLGRLQNVLKRLAKTVSGLERKTDAALAKVEAFQQTGIETHSVRQELKVARKSQSMKGAEPRLKDKVR
ncbi:hypothetical protein NE619_17225 [Anaerovorax odorimutans]|uniref:Uncharacterized protein n=1 Tax=Anaerovorax odorimutans TaxID=109327 RepID=A0ABT1RTE3_9FIRM|nr:DUF6674 family protein [Anaerovorax odorimutans]MCQ4638475.1 hypothetical protein [Anaerovorax odorimutans]